jgi:undecaprenyl-diphosphatase
LDQLQALILAIIQGLTEFLPISSSAHLILPFQILGWKDQGLAFDTAVHLGSLIAVVWYLKQDIGKIICGLMESVRCKSLNVDGRLGIMVLIASLPIIPVGYLGAGIIEAEFRSIGVIACATIVFAVLLAFADRQKRASPDSLSINWVAALLIGIAQCFALVPGTSRSGVTMTAALFLGLSRLNAARFSFLMSIPAILGAATLKTFDLLDSPEPAQWDLIILGMSASAVSAYLCIALFIKVINRIGFMPFVIYRLILGAGLFLILIW